MKKGVKKKISEFKEVNKKIEEKKQKESYSIANFFSKSKALLFKPGRFLNSIEKEGKYQPILRTFVLLYLVYFILIFIIGLVFVGNSMNIYQIIQSFLYAIIVSVVIPFLVSGFVYLGVRIFKGKQGFFNVFKPVTYALMIFIFYSLIIFIFAMLVPFNNISADSLSSVSQEYAVQLWKDYLLQPGAVIYLVLNLISLIHVFIFLIMSISKFQKMTKSKSAFAVVLSAIIAFAVIILFVVISYLASPESFAGISSGAAA